MFRVTTALATTLVLAGCTTLGSSFTAPKIDSNARYGAATAAGSKSVTASTQWWLAFNDSQLNGLIEAGLKQNLTVAQAVERVVAARETVAASAIGLPSGSTAGQSSVSGSSNTSTTEVSSSTSASLSWEIDLFGGLAKKREAAAASIDAATEEANGARLTLIGDIATAYVEARGYQDRIHIAQTTLTSQNQTLQLTRQQQELGVATRLDLAQLTGDVASTAASIPSLEISLAASIHRLGVLLGQEPSALKSMFATGAQIPRLSGTVIAGIPSDLMRDRPDIRQAERTLAQAASNVGVAEADLYPSLTLSGNLSVSSAAAWSLGPTLSLPIFNRGALEAMVRLEESDAKTAYLAYRQTVLEAVEEIENALVAFSKQQTRRSELAKSYTSYTEATDIADELYRAGSSTLLNVLTAQRSLYSSRDALAQSSVAVAIQYITLCKALGGGWDISGTTTAETRS
ncbi:outer membrane protein, multidrug efflux system [Devosia sp. YR412]|uniref:efflux transporter outer membrane subunit n=1 Tax=Devosia sp. YR412 TaxID=1881030 RepID=UPI0008D66E7C|nr:efflux transporter outer membrane subunit [Devosia sp. YR412]SEQ52509.1 outer membrane protein, multidrug efflux system [Devosia sp. YR412]